MLINEYLEKFIQDALLILATEGSSISNVAPWVRNINQSETIHAKCVNIGTDETGEGLQDGDGFCVTATFVPEILFEGGVKVRLSDPTRVRKTENKKDVLVVNENEYIKVAKKNLGSMTGEVIVSFNYRQTPNGPVQIKESAQIEFIPLSI